MTQRQSGLDLTVSALRGLILAAERFRQAMADHFHLGVSDTLVLSHLASADGQLTPREIGDRMLISSGTLSAIIDRLVEGRFVTRIPNPEDRRSVLVTLNPAGRRALTYARRRMEHAVTAAFDGGPPPAGLADQLWRLAAGLSDQADQAAHNSS